MRLAALLLILALSGASVAPSLIAQQPELVVQAANTTATPAAAAKTGSPQDDAALQTAIRGLQDAKKANEDLLKKQEATLQQLDDLQKAADQLRIFSKRG